MIVCVCLRECFSSSSRKHRSCREIINDTSDNILAAASRGSSSSSAWRAGWRGRARKSISRAEVLKARDEDDVAGFVLFSTIVTSAEEGHEVGVSAVV